MPQTRASPSLADAQPRPGPIGVFDSGVGGLTVLHALHRRLPSAPMIYVGDTSHAPYGERSETELRARCERIVGHLVGRGARLVVVACNTATVLAIEWLRQRWPELTFVGVEPGVKPAAARTRSGRIAVMATPATSTSARLRRLIEAHAPQLHVHVQPCPGLADAIERGVLEGPALQQILHPCCDGVNAANVDTVVLGCTHYPFVEASIRQLLAPRVKLIDTGAAVAERVASLWSAADAAGAPPIEVTSTGATAIMQRLWRRQPGFESAAVASFRC